MLNGLLACTWNPRALLLLQLHWLDCQRRLDTSFPLSIDVLVKRGRRSRMAESAAVATRPSVGRRGNRRRLLLTATRLRRPRRQRL